MIEIMDIRLNEIAVAIGAPMNPSRIGSGPHTVRTERLSASIKWRNVGEAQRTEKVVEQRVHWRYPKDDSRGHSEETCPMADKTRSTFMEMVAPLDDDEPCDWKYRRDIALNA